MKTPEISIIIPAYNAQDTIIKCLDSVMRQDGVRDCEVIVVNDGSTDNTANIVQEYRYNRPNIQLVNMLSNRGISIARNNGMRLANGRFVTFVDADDIVGVSADNLQPLLSKPGAEFESIGPMKIRAAQMHNIATFEPALNKTYFTNMLKHASPETDIVLGGKITLDTRNNILATHTYAEPYKFTTFPSDKSVALINAYMRENANFALYRRQFLTGRHLQFEPEIKLDEDILFCMQAVLYADHIVAAPDATYMYTRHENSASTPADYWPAYDRSAVQVFSMLLNTMYKYPQYSDIFAHWFQHFLAIGQIAGTQQAHFPNSICKNCTSHINRCPTCKKLRRLLESNIRTLVHTQKQK